MHTAPNVMITLMSILNQIRLYHWQTLSHPRHTATDKLHEELSELVDKFIEVLTGRLIIDNNNPKYRILLDKTNIKLQSYSDDNGVELLSNIKKYLEGKELAEVLKLNTELINIRDEMLASVNQTSYLFSLA